MAESGGTLIDNGYESGTNGNDLTVGTLTKNGGTITYSNTTAAGGSQSAKIAATGPSFGAQVDYTGLTINNGQEVRFWVYPGQTNKLCLQAGDDFAATAGWYLRWYSNGQVQYYTGAAYADAGAYSASTWTQYRIVLTLPGSSATWKLYQRTSLQNGWTQMGGTFNYGTAAATSSTAIRFTSFNTYTNYVDSVQYGTISDYYPATPIRGARQAVNRAATR